MKAIKATYKDGRIKLSEKPTDPGPMEVVVVFPESADDPWNEILRDPHPRPALLTLAKKVKKEIAQGKAEPLDFSQL